MHTDGPWQYEFAESGGYDCMSDSFHISVADQPSQFICEVDLSNFGHGMRAQLQPERLAEAEANARLIAAAPDLLAAVKYYLEWGAMTGSDRDLFEEKFRAAIAKAEGT